MNVSELVRSALFKKRGSFAVALFILYSIIMLYIMHHKILKLTQSLIVLMMLTSSSFAYYKTTLGPCTKPVTFKLGALDDNFGLSREQAITHLKNGAGIWNSSLRILNKKKNLFEYNEKSKDAIAIDFVFDERQSTTIKNNILKEEALTKKVKLDSEKDKIDTGLADIEKKKADYTLKVNGYEKDLAYYNNRVIEINSSGGATAEQLEEFNFEKESLDNRRAELVKESAKLASEVKDYNLNVNTHNAKVAEVNGIVNEINGSNLGLFEEGVYRDGKIIIYEYSDTKVLERLIAHELGHARGMDHVQDKDALMYYINSSKNISITTDDIDEYKKICEVKG